MKLVAAFLSLICLLAFATIEGSEDAHMWALGIWSCWWGLVCVVGHSQSDESET